MQESQGPPVVLITGTSSGFGRVSAERLAGAGMRVFGTSRAPVDEPDASVPYRVIKMDVDDDESVSAAVEQVIAEAGRIDVLVNNAGVGMAGSIEDTTIAEAKRQMETNFFGVVRTSRAVLPHMRSRESGKIINISSIGGLIALPFQAFYSASKFGVEALTEALRLEVAPFGIKVCCIEPGDFATEMTDKRIFTAGADSNAYGLRMRKTISHYERDERSGADPVLVAELVERLIVERTPKVRYLVGAAPQKAAALLKRVVGSRLFERILRKVYGL